MALNQAFDVDSLADLRRAVLAAAADAGMPDHRAAEVMLAVHELAANAVRHGGGAGRARLCVADGRLCCRVSDAGPGSLHGDAYLVGTGEAPSWPIEPRHGLWLVRTVADQVSITSSLDGSEVTVAFALPGFRGDVAEEVRSSYG